LSAIVHDKLIAFRYGIGKQNAALEYDFI